eukprot:4449113-Prymnesium_polylepis.1
MIAQPNSRVELAWALLAEPHRRPRRCGCSQLRRQLAVRDQCDSRPVLQLLVRHCAGPSVFNLSVSAPPLAGSVAPGPHEQKTKTD